MLLTAPFYERRFQHFETPSNFDVWKIFAVEQLPRRSALADTSSGNLFAGFINERGK